MKYDTILVTNDADNQGYQHIVELINTLKLKHFLKQEDIKLYGKFMKLNYDYERQILYNVLNVP